MATVSASSEHEPSDQALLAQVVCLDEGALAELYDRYGNLVYSIALRVTQDQAVAEEVVQDVFHAVWRTAGSFQTNGSVVHWLIGITRHRAIDATRARVFQARHREQTIELALELATNESTDEQVERLLAGEFVRAALLRLSPAQREALGLAYYRGLSQAQIAAYTGAPLGTVKARLRGGLLQLRRQLAL